MLLKLIDDVMEAYDALQKWNHFLGFRFYVFVRLFF